MDTWLIWKLTGGTDGGQFVTDISNAARTNLMDIRTRQWHSETCKRFGLEVDMLPEIRSNAEVFGHVKHGPLQGICPACHQSQDLHTLIYQNPSGTIYHPKRNAPLKRLSEACTPMSLCPYCMHKTKDAERLQATVTSDAAVDCSFVNQ